MERKAEIKLLLANKLSARVVECRHGGFRLRCFVVRREGSIPSSSTKIKKRKEKCILDTHV